MNSRAARVAAVFEVGGGEATVMEEECCIACTYIQKKKKEDHNNKRRTRRSVRRRGGTGRICVCVYIRKRELNKVGCMYEWRMDGRGAAGGDRLGGERRIFSWSNSNNSSAAATQRSNLSNTHRLPPLHHPITHTHTRTPTNNKRRLSDDE